MLSTNSSFEEQLAVYSYMASVVSEWIHDTGEQEKISAIDILLWWSRCDEAES